MKIEHQLALSATPVGFTLSASYERFTPSVSREGFALSALCEGPAPKTLPTNSLVSTTSKLIENKRLQVHSFGHLRKTRGRGNYPLIISYGVRFTLPQILSFQHVRTPSLTHSSTIAYVKQGGRGLVIPIASVRSVSFTSFTSSLSFTSFPPPPTSFITGYLAAIAPRAGKLEPKRIPAIAGRPRRFAARPAKQEPDALD